MRRLHIAGVLIAASAACSPATTRPAFAPRPQATVVLLAAEPPRVAAEAVSWLGAQGIPIRRQHPADRYVETAWYFPPRDSAGTGGTGSVRVRTRVWADPAGPERTRLTVETVYREVEDPSRPPRDLERPAPAGSPGQRMTERLVAALTTTFEVL